MILIFVIMVTLLIGLMGVAIIVVTKAEVSISGNYRQSEEAFSSTESAVAIGVLLSRVALHPVLGRPQDLLTAASGGQPKYPLTVEINEERLNLESLVREAAPYAYAKRYLESAFGTKTAAKKPHLLFKVGQRVVAMASISLDDTVSLTGYSLGASDRYDPSGGENVPVDIVLTVTGTSTQAFELDDLNAPRSIITSITRDYFY
ncbi:MAG: hypothetical protein LBS60_01685 [Deltaproteobacteria bacterium]|jgi:hypothetical protein|nr:hypothetical protein [Deltaproteobacteria bacterium]